jgi:RNA polymerase sigma-70 factor (ECF subfamily)
MQSLKEKYLLFKAKSFNDTEAYGEIYDRYIERIYRFVFFKVGNQSDAEDIASETFLKVWQYIKDSQPIKNFNALLYSIARNLVIDHYRSQAKRLVVEEPILTDIKDTADAAETIDIKTERVRILKALKFLKDEYSEVIILRFLDDLSISETAKIIGKSQNNTRVLIHRALGALRKALEEETENL